jgi:hypothetical protein
MNMYKKLLPFIIPAALMASPLPSLEKKFVKGTELQVSVQQVFHKSAFLGILITPKEPLTNFFREFANISAASKIFNDSLLYNSQTNSPGQTFYKIG